MNFAMTALLRLLTSNPLDALLRHAADLPSRMRACVGLLAALTCTVMLAGCGGGQTSMTTTTPGIELPCVPLPFLPCGNQPAQPGQDFLYPEVLDTAFGSGGYMTDGTGLRETDFLGAFNVFDFIIDQADRYVVVGNRVTGRHEVWLRRLLADGRPDPSCNGNGWLIFTTGGPANPAALLQLPDGRYLIAGLLGNASIHAVRPDCTIDTTFGTGGRAVFPSPAGPTAITGGIKALALDAAGRVLATMRAANGRVLVARFLADGTVDTTFGDNGTAWHAGPDSGSFDPMAIMVRPDGRILVAGRMLYSLQVGYWPAFAQLHADGALDTTFGDSGFVSIRPAPNPFVVPLSAILLPDGAAIQAGLTQPAVLGGVLVETDAYFVRITPDGRPDPSFGANGVLVWTAGPANRNKSSNYATALSLARDGALLACQNWLNNALVTSRAAIPQVIVQKRSPLTGAAMAGFGLDGTGWLPRRQRDEEAYCIRMRTARDGSTVALLDYRAKLALDESFALVRVRD